MTPEPTIAVIQERLSRVIQDPDIFVACAPNDMRFLLAALKKYGGHLPDCPWGRDEHNEIPCTCGWDTLNETPEKEE